MESGDTRSKVCRRKSEEKGGDEREEIEWISRKKNGEESIFKKMSQSQKVRARCSGSKGKERSIMKGLQDKTTQALGRGKINKEGQEGD